MVEKFERIRTGVEGLDEKMGGGFVKNSINLITGKTGTGKTAFATTFICKGAMMGEPGIYLTTEESIDDIRSDIVSMFDFDVKKLEEKKLIKFIFIEPVIPSKSITTKELASVSKLYIYNLYDKLEGAIKELNAKRVVIDSITIIELFIRDEYLARASLLELIKRMKNLGVTVIATETIPEKESGLSTSGIVEYLVDSVIKLDFIPVAEEFKRTLTIRKMRRTKHSVMIHPFEISRNGLRIIEIGV